MKTMQLCFFRHGLAVDRGDSDYADEDRPLTTEGEKKTRSAAEGVQRIDMRFDAVLTSPWLRARQTAEILAETLPVPEPQILEELAGNRSVAELVQALTRYRGQNLLLVGHEPLLSATVVHLLGGRWTLDLRKSGACSIEVDTVPVKKPGKLLWHLSSRQLRWISKG